ncbi:MAG: T9SS type A sorting domain-containing protein [Flavobacteriaceae bacterium]|nr:T9SS type A sorting domain-containing protein [Flavobacteriaceae bacterium]
MKKTLQVLVLIILPGFVFAQYGVLDSSFDFDGKKIISFAIPNDYGEFVLVQQDSKIIVGGSSSLNGGEASFSLARMNPSGTFDPSFGTAGKVTTSYGNQGFEAFNGVLQSDGKIVVVGNHYTDASMGFSQVAVVRYNTNGTLDTNFDTDGIVTTQLPTSNEDFGIDVKLQSDGKILVGVQSRINFDRDIVLIRYNTDGSLDNSFGTNGIARTQLNTTNEAIYDIALQSDGKIVAVGVISGISNDDVAVFRYNSDGSLDTTFANNGKFTYDFASSHNYASCIVITSDNKLVIGGWYNNSSSSGGYSPFLMRLTNSGVFDTSFNTTGILVQTSDEMIFDVVLQSDNKIITIGGLNSSFGVSKFNVDGSFDSTFGTNGKVETVININYCTAKNGALQSDGKIVVVGSTYGSPFTKYGVARYTNDGTLATNSFLETKFSLYPNPSNGNFTIQMGKNLIGSKVSIYSMLGKKVREFRIETASLNQNLNKGIYLIEIQKENQKLVKKLIIN